jgi:succinate dehydrogenase/fumarate reductase flavoprotein subunit
MNEEMVQKYAPMLTKGNTPIGNPGDTGTGIEMGMAVGGAAINMHEGFISIPYYPPATMIHGIAINDKAQRFINEDVYHARLGHAALNQQGDRLYFVLNIDDYGSYEKLNYLFAPIAGTGETVEELEEELELRQGTLQQTIALYNEDCAAGEDTQYHKAAEWLKPLEPPLVALDITPGRGAFLPFFTLGGLDTLPSGEVVNARRQVIPGLYAAGRNACGVPRRAEGYSSGMSVGDATFSGRMAGKQVAAAERR